MLKKMHDFAYVMNIQYLSLYFHLKKIDMIKNYHANGLG
jgi:hypothetical protein